jgi:cell wall-associated NlpC family hydrolase
MRLPAAAALLLALLAAPAWASNRQETWAASAIRLTTSRGLFPATPATFRPAAPLTREALAALVAALGGTSVANPARADAEVTIAGLDAAIVRALGLRGVAEQFTAVARSAGLDPPSRFGTEVVARLLGLRHDLPAPLDGLERQPGQAATRADAAFSAARVLTLGVPVPADARDRAVRSPAADAEAGAGVHYVKGLADEFAIPVLSPLQREIVHTALSLIGYPYVLGGDDERAGPGFDCSGFVWRVFRLASYPGAAGLARTLPARTAAQMALDVPRAERVGAAELEPADLVFFRPTPEARVSSIDHVGIYLGNGWLIESAGQGVSLGRLDWYGKGFAWGQRPLAELRLEAWPGP